METEVGAIADAPQPIREGIEHARALADGILTSLYADGEDQAIGDAGCTEPGQRTTALLAVFARDALVSPPDLPLEEDLLRRCILLNNVALRLAQVAVEAIHLAEDHGFSTEGLFRYLTSPYVLPDVDEGPGAGEGE